MRTLELPIVCWPSCEPRAFLLAMCTMYLHNEAYRNMTIFVMYLLDTFLIKLTVGMIKQIQCDCHVLVYLVLCLTHLITPFIPRIYILRINKVLNKLVWIDHHLVNLELHVGTVHLTWRGGMVFWGEIKFCHQKTMW